MIYGGAPSLFWVDSTDAWLNEGQNVLAIQVHNFNSNSSDLSCIPFLTIGRDTPSDNTLSTAEEIELPVSILHTNFKISSEGETIIITGLDSVIIDSLHTGELQSDVSIGRINNGENYGLFLDPSPGEPNGEEAVLGILNNIVFLMHLVFISDPSLIVSISTNDLGVSVHYTLDGSDPTTSSPLYTGS